MTERTNRLAEVRKKVGLSQQQLAEKVGAHWITISKLERGKMHLTFEWAERLGAALGVGEFDLFEDRETERTIFVEGAVAEKGKVFYYHDDQGKEDYEAVLVPLGTQRSAADLWLTIETDDFFPVLHIGDLIRTTYLPLDVNPNDYVGRLMVASEKDSTRFLGILTPGRTEGYFEMRPLSGAPKQEIRVENLASVSLIIPMPIRYDQKTTQDPPKIL